MADEHEDQRKHGEKHHRKKEKGEHGHDSAIREAFSALKHMPSMNPGGVAPIPDEVKGTTDKPKDSDKG